jgi:hypothetical protein
MRRMTHRQQRQALYGWIKWLPVLALAFAPLFFDAWLNIQTWRNDYEISKLNRKVREYRAQLDEMRVEEAKLETLERLALAADSMTLKEPNPDQKQTVLYAASEKVTLTAAEPLTLASNIGRDGSPLLPMLPPWLENGVQSAQDRLKIASEIMFRNDPVPVPVKEEAPVVAAAPPAPAAPAPEKTPTPQSVAPAAQEASAKMVHLTPPLSAEQLSLVETL